MSIIDTSDRVLSVLVDQDPRLAPLAQMVRTLRADADAIDAARYQPDRATELKNERRAQAVSAMAAELARLETEAAQQDLEQQAAVEHQRLVSAHGHTVDPARMSAASSPAEIVLLLREAEAADPGSLRQAWSFAEPRLRQMAQTDMREHRMPHGTSAFTAWATWQVRMRTLQAGHRDVRALRDRAAREQAGLRRRVLAVARVAGLDVAVQRAAVQAAMPAAPQGTMAVGRWWDVHPEWEGRR